MLCADSASEARDLAQEHIANYYRSVVSHYEFTKVENFQKKGYSSYAENAAALGAYGVDNAAKGFVEELSDLWLVLGHVRVPKWLPQVSARVRDGLPHPSQDFFPYPCWSCSAAKRKALA